MTRAQTKWTKNLFIVSSLQKGLIKGLSCGARQAYFMRDYAQLEIIGERLASLSPQSEELGRYYLALAVSRQSGNGHKQARGEFELLANSSMPSIRAVALTALAAGEIASGVTGLSTTKKVVESSTLALKLDNPIALIQSQSIYSVLLSENGNHQESLQVLRGLRPIIDKLGSQYEPVKTDFYNSVAYELMQVGRVKESQVFINFCLNSPHLKAYPEWLETAREIHRHTKVRSLLYAMGQVQGQITYKKKPSNVLQFRLRSKPPAAYPLVLKMPDGELHFCDYPVNEIHQLENLARTVTTPKGIEMK